ncbi:hypothetical protein QNN03_36665 [Streptomyces sp. GXMU-J15]|uniref:Uncharacterized protein n=1 Tax=Streptomyces fuscus TaxID=3048495 RepID=A0ABT7JEM1_9ACTN|nr:hypothetical protein [Streptomyces fuscus]MDL2081973.1 hypothetical protein [Streptomyces fuscus]
MDLSNVTLGDLGASVAAVVALVALGVAIWSAKISFKGLEAAQRSATAAEVSADAARRSADADEEMVRLARGEADSPEAPWHLIQSGKSSYRLMNNSDRPAENVEISGSVLTPNFQNGDTIPGRSAVRVLDVRSMAESEPLSVTWSRPGSTERLGPWVHPF